MASSLTYVGYTPGRTSAELHPSSGSPWDVAGFTTAFHATGPGAPGGQGAPYSLCLKNFDYTGYPNSLPNWSNTSLEASVVAANGGVPLMILYATGGGPPAPTPPSASRLESILGSLPAGQKIGFVWVSEAEANTDFGSGLTNAAGGAAFVSSIGTFSTNLNTALSFMQAHPVVGNSAGFYTRTNFPLMNSALMSHYQSAADTSWIPNFGDVDAYGADMYHKGTNTNNHVLADPRYANYVQSVKNKLTATQFSQSKWAFPEYGIDLAGIASEQARANLLQADFNDMTGASAPGQGLFLWNYWYQIGNSGQHYPFPVPGSETEAQAAPTISVWQGIISSVSGSSNVNVFGTTATASVVAPPGGSPGGAFFVRSINNATTGANATTTLNVLKDTHTQPGDLIQIWVVTNSANGVTWSCPGFTPVPAVS